VKLSNRELVSIIKGHRANSLGAEDGRLSDERAKAMNHYHGRPYGNEVEGRSQVVSRDLAEAVDWALPGILRVFTQSGKIAEFDPVGPEDEELAKQESDYVNQVLMKDNPGFMVLHDAIKDTLLLKNGYAKHWWEVTDKIEEVEYTGLTMDAIAMMFADLEKAKAKVEVLGQESYTVGEPPPIDPMTGQPTGPMPVEMFDIKLKITRKTGKLIWMAVPAEEVRVSKKCRGSLQDSPFTEHVTKKTRSELIEMSMPRAFVDELPAHGESEYSTQALSRDSTDDESETTGQVGDKSMDEILYCEAYLKVDADGDGIAELRKIVTVADQIPPGSDWNEPISAVPMTGFVAKRVPHRHVGESLDDEIGDLQEIMTVLKRQLLDNIYRVNNAEMAVNQNANLRDFMTSTPGGVKRIKGTDSVQNAFAPIVTTPIIDKLLPVIDFFESSKESRTGISKATTGLDPDILKQTTKGAFIENLQKASQKMEMITRMLGETGVKESVLQAHAILMRHQDQARTVQLRGKWVPVNPKEWKERTDLTVRVGLGTGSEEEKRAKLEMLFGMLQTLLPMGLVGPAQMYNLFTDIAEAMGFDSPEKYVLTPGSPEFQQLAQENQAKAAQGQGGVPDVKGAAEVKAQTDMQMAQAKDAFERERAMLNARLQSQRDEADRQTQVFIEQMRLASKEAIETMKAEMQGIRDGMRIDLGQQGLGAGMQQPMAQPMPPEQMQPQPQQQPGPINYPEPPIA